MRKLALIILDGFGLGKPLPNNAIHAAPTPFFDYLWSTFPHTSLQASGEFVGLPDEQIGGSEVGHLTMGAGRVIYQQLPRINRSLAGTNPEIINLDSFRTFLMLSRQRRTHLIGLVSPGGVHSHENHLFALLTIMKQFGCIAPFIHFIADGRDTAPQSAVSSARRLLDHVKKLHYGSVATLSGRFYAMDRDENTDRSQKTIDAMIARDKTDNDTDSFEFSDALIQAITKSYEDTITDEFILPKRLPKGNAINPDDVLFFFNFRADRMKQLVRILAQQTKISPERIFTMCRYDGTFVYPVIFEKEQVSDTIGEVLSTLHLTQLKAAETEKAPHVTYFFNGGLEQTFAGEIRTVAPSNKVRHDELPKMKTEEILANVAREVQTAHPDFILINFANPDMVGHTGNFNAVVEGVSHVDQTLKRLSSFLTKHQYICLITADHGNAEYMYDLETKEPHTAHTLNPVPFIVYDPASVKNRRIVLDQNPENGLGLIAGSALELMEIPHSYNHFRSLIK